MSATTLWDHLKRIFPPTFDSFPKALRAAQNPDLPQHNSALYTFSTILMIIFDNVNISGWATVRPPPIQPPDALGDDSVQVDDRLIKPTDPPRSNKMSPIKGDNIVQYVLGGLLGFAITIVIIVAVIHRRILLNRIAHHCSGMYIFNLQYLNIQIQV